MVLNPEVTTTKRSLLYMDSFEIERSSDLVQFFINTNVPIDRFSTLAWISASFYIDPTQY